MQSKATTVEQYLAELPEDRRAAIKAVREVILKNLDKDYAEGMGYGMIMYSVPHSVFPSGYHCDPTKPLMFAALASQKGYMSLYLMGAYGNSEHTKWLSQAWAKTGKKLDMGKVCVRFKDVGDLPLEVIGESIRRLPAREYVDFYVKALESMGKGVDGKKLKTGAGKKAAAKGAGKKVARKVGKKKAAKKAGARKTARR